MRLGAILRLDRTIKEESLDERAEEMGVPKTTLSRLEKGKDIENRTFVKVLNWLAGDDGQSSDPADR